MTNLLIVNADDFGLSQGINYGIIEAHRHGVVSSTTAMMNAPAIEHAAEISADFPALGVGLHFVLSFGVPLTPMTSLVREGQLGKWLVQQATLGLLASDEIAAELQAQYQRFISLFGYPPVHIDSHHHAHFVPPVWAQVVSFAREKNIPLRIDREALHRQGIVPQGVRSTDGFIGDFYADNVSAQAFLLALSQSKARGERSVELMCHPGYVDQGVKQSRYCDQRLDELAVLTTASLRQAVEAQGYWLGNYGDLAQIDA